MSKAINDLPPEIVIRIFHSCLPDPTDSYTHTGPVNHPVTRIKNSSIDPYLPPWTLSQVCRSWRSLAIGTPSLWNNVQIRLSDHWSRMNQAWVVQAAAHRLQLQINRALAVSGVVEANQPSPMNPGLHLVIQPGLPFFTQHEDIIYTPISYLVFPVVQILLSPEALDNWVGIEVILRGGYDDGDPLLYEAFEEACKRNGHGIEGLRRLKSFRWPGRMSLGA